MNATEDTMLLDVFRRAVQHFLEIVLQKGKITILLNKITNRSIWYLNNESVIHIKYDDDNDPDHGFLMAKIYKNIYNLNDTIADELFKREITFQNTILPKLEKLVKTPIRPATRNINEQLRIIFVSDMLQKGYKLISPTKGLSLDESIKAIKLMAQYHAGTVALCEKEPELVKTLTVRPILEKSDHVMSCFINARTPAITFLENVYPSVANKLKHFKSIQSIRDITNFYNYDEKEFCVLNNGDFSIANLLLHNDDTTLPLLMNFQMAVYSSPAIDLLHFLNTSPSVDVIYDEEEKLLETYLEELNKTMGLLNCETKPPTMEELKAAIQKRIWYVVFASITFRLHTMIKEYGELIISTNEYNELVKKMLFFMYYKNYLN